jgi:hypothetical protein
VTSVMTKSRRRRNFTSGEASGARLEQRLLLQTTERIGRQVGKEVAVSVAAAEDVRFAVDDGIIRSIHLENIKNKITRTAVCFVSQCVRVTDS